MWKVNAGRRSLLASEFLQQNVVAIGWREAGDCTGAGSRAAVLEKVSAAYPDKTDRQNEVASAQIWRFMTELRRGDNVTTYDPSSRLYHLGKIIGDPHFNPRGIEQLPTQRAVKWNHYVRRDDLSAVARYRLNAILTLFKVADQTSVELMELAAGRKPETPITQEEPIEEVADPFEGLADQALERIKDRLLSLEWDEMQELVAALLRALGYRTVVSPAGRDRGKDIVASRDGFGFEAPRIVVEVKHRRGAMGAAEIRAFLGGRHPEDRGLYVSTGGFTQEARYEAERASTVTHLLDINSLAQSLVDNYEQLDEAGRALLPLTKLYWPA